MNGSDRGGDDSQDVDGDDSGSNVDESRSGPDVLPVALGRALNYAISNPAEDELLGNAGPVKEQSMARGAVAAVEKKMEAAKAQNAKAAEEKERQQRKMKYQKQLDSVKEKVARDEKALSGHDINNHY